jgi:hypothetical protein
MAQFLPVCLYCKKSREQHNSAIDDGRIVPHDFKCEGQPESDEYRNIVNYHLPVENLANPKKYP